MKHTVKNLRFPKAAVKTVAKFRQVAGQMLGADAMVDTPDIAFNIGDQGVDQGFLLRPQVVCPCGLGLSLDPPLQGSGGLGVIGRHPARIGELREWYL
jgi:hypothetical protein